MQLLILIFLLAVIDFHTAFAEEELKTLHFGVLSFRPKEMTIAQWQPLAQELEHNLPGYKIDLQALTYPELDKAAKDKQLDLVLTNPEHYILLKNQISMNAVATLITLDQGHPAIEFAGVIFTRTDRQDIQTLEDLNHKVIASPSENSLGGYLMQRWKLEKNDIHPKEYIFTGMPHDKVVDEVLAGNVDAGFVRSGVLESLEKAGKLRLGENSNVKVLTPGISEEDEETEHSGHKIYSLHSTEHYPEWSFNVCKSLHPDITRKITLTLLQIDASSLVAKTAGIAGFTSPSDYTSVETLMLRLRYHPDELKYFNFDDVLWRYRENVVISAVLGLLETVRISV